MHLKKLILPVLVGALYVASAQAHTPQEIRDALVSDLEGNFDREWLEDIFNHQDSCEGHGVQAEKLEGGWSELRSRVLSDESVARGVKFFQENREDLIRLSKEHGGGDFMVFITIAILRIETDFGENMVGEPVISGLVDRYHQVWNRGGERARKAVAETEILPFLSMAKDNVWNICAVLGSRAQAFGYPHFTPASLKWAVDGDGDGKIDIVRSIPDAAASIMHLLILNGWGNSHNSKVSAVFWYNPIRKYRSRREMHGRNPYVQIVFQYAEEVHRNSSPRAPQRALFLLRIRIKSTLKNSVPEEMLCM